MAFLHKETFEIIQGSYAEEDYDIYFEVDDILALPIRELNLKGYKTLLCCSGHPFMTISQTFHSEENVRKLKDYPAIIRIEAVHDSICPELSKRVICKEAEDLLCYVVFAKGVVLPHLPIGFCIEDEAIVELPQGLAGTVTISRSLSKDAVVEADIYNFFSTSLDAAMKLYEWSLTLPPRIE